MTKYNKAFQRYLQNDFDPAQAWAASASGSRFIRTKIPSLEILKSREKDVMAAVYAIYLNGRLVYIGQSLRTVRRLYVHAYHIATDPLTYFGIYSNEIESIEVKILTPPIYKETIRLSEEASCVRSMQPLLQPYGNISGMNPDACLPRDRRREAMIAAGVIPVAASEN